MIPKWGYDRPKWICHRFTSSPLLLSSPLPFSPPLPSSPPPHILLTSSSPPPHLLLTYSSPPPHLIPTSSDWSASFDSKRASPSRQRISIDASQKDLQSS